MEYERRSDMTHLLLLMQQDKRVLHGGSLIPSWEVIIVGGLVLLALVLGLVWLVRRARRVAATDEGEGWGYDRFSIMREEKPSDLSPQEEEPVAERASTLEEAGEAPSQMAQAPTEAEATLRAAVQEFPREVPAEKEVPIHLEAPKELPTAQPTGEPPLSPQPESRFRFQAVAEAEMGESRSRFRRLAVTAILILTIGAYVYSPVLRDSLSRGWNAAVGRFSSKNHRGTSDGGGLKPLPVLDVTQSEVPAGPKVSLRLRIRNISSDPISSIFAEVALSRADAKIPETRLAAIEPTELAPNQEGTAEVTIETSAFVSYQVSRILKSTGEEIPFRLTHAVISGQPASAGRSRR